MTASALAVEPPARESFRSWTFAPAMQRSASPFGVGRLLASSSGKIKKISYNFDLQNP
jgi:hypothetical protein